MVGSPLQHVIREDLFGGLDYFCFKTGNSDLDFFVGEPAGERQVIGIHQVAAADLPGEHGHIDKTLEFQGSLVHMGGIYLSINLH